MHELRENLPRTLAVARKELRLFTKDPGGLVVVMQVVLLLGVYNAVFAMPLGRSLLGLLLVTLALALAATSLGMVLGFVLGGLGGSIQIGLTPLYRGKGLLGFISQLTAQRPCPGRLLAAHDGGCGAGAGAAAGGRAATDGSSVRPNRYSRAAVRVRWRRRGMR